ncbi:MAG: peptidoglycan-binding domain-containing protein [Actinomycetota bacterium]
MAETGPRDRFDDWFDEPEPADAWATRVDRLARARETDDWETEDWIEETAIRPPARSRRSRPSAPVVLGLAALAVCLLLGILAAAGVFSSGGKPRTLSTTGSTTAPTTAGTTTTAAPTVQVPTSILKPGDSGAKVTLLQRALARAGYSTGKADGSYGPATKSAVAQFQQAHGLTADGVAGPKTLAALAAALHSATG